jgi:hypothetical protein
MIGEYQESPDKKLDKNDMEINIMYFLGIFATCVQKSSSIFRVINCDIRKY